LFYRDVFVVVCAVSVAGQEVEIMRPRMCGSPDGCTSATGPDGHARLTLENYVGLMYILTL
jgi:hypothetical protein